LRQVLEDTEHFEVLEAHDGQEAVSLSCEVYPDAVVLDLAMPVMDGLTAARKISKSLPQTPILMCTMHASKQLELEAQIAGVRKIISKTDTNAIVPAIRELLSASASSASTSGENPSLTPPPLATLSEPSPTPPPPLTPRNGPKRAA